VEEQVNGFDSRPEGIEDLPLLPVEKEPTGEEHR
jgi:hypothetical protein